VNTINHDICIGLGYVNTINHDICIGLGYVNTMIMISVYGVDM